jgi:hypothetical protein
MRRAMVAPLLLAAACTQRLYAGPPLAAEQVAEIHVGTAVVREIDGVQRRGGAVDVAQFEVTPGAHRLVLVFELPARTLGMRTLPAQAGEGTCVLELMADAGRQYYLGSRPRGDANTPRWDGAWEAWARDPTASSVDDVIARCASQPVQEAATAVPIAAPPASPP